MSSLVWERTPIFLPDRVGLSYRAKHLLWDVKPPPIIDASVTDDSIQIRAATKPIKHAGIHFGLLRMNSDGK